MTAANLKIQSKKLKSGRFQIQFKTVGFEHGYYGYLLAEPKTSLNEVIEKINRHLGEMENTGRYFHRNLFSVRKQSTNTGKILIFKQ